MTDTPLVQAASYTGFITFSYAVVIGTAAVAYFVGSTFRNTKKDVEKFMRATADGLLETQFVESELLRFATYLRNERKIFLNGLSLLHTLLDSIQKIEEDLSKFALELEHRFDLMERSTSESRGDRENARARVRSHVEFLVASTKAASVGETRHDLTGLQSPRINQEPGLLYLVFIWIWRRKELKENIEMRQLMDSRLGFIQSSLISL
jgi:hypothetical protein